jgi:hypothetical protein
MDSIDFNSLLENIETTKNDLSQARNTIVEDKNKNFSSNNVEDILEELFTFVVNGKNLLASAINDKSGKNEATQQMNFQELANLIYTVDMLERQNLILNINNKFDLKMSLDTTFEDINKTLNNMTLDSVRKTFEIQSIMDFSNLNIDTILDLSKNMNLSKCNIQIESIIDFSNLNVGVI